MSRRVGSPHGASVAKAVPLAPLAWRTMPLDGRVLIEASAGTGKTWNIGLIYLRLLLERGLGVEHILVATFTEAAAQELRERLRQRIIEAERWLLQPEALADVATRAQTLEEQDSLPVWLADRCADPAQAKQALRRIQLARADLDRAPISTIHALCQRIQRDHPLETGAAFTSDRLLEEEELRRECVEDFWRRRYLAAPIDARESSAVLADGPEGLLRDLATIAATQDGLVPADGGDALRHMLESLVANAAAIAELRRLASDKALYAPSRTALPGRLADIADILEVSSDVEGRLAAKLDKAFENAAIDEQQAVGASLRLREHPLIRELQALRSLLVVRATFARGTVLAAAAEACRIGVPERARRRNVLTFSMLIDQVHARLYDADAGAILADRLFDAYPAALIDEFQDTDPRQYGIFDRIYRDAGGNERGSLVMIGDPKQAIYGFRGGDIGAYLAASAQTARRYSLATNHRSAAALVAALNALYGDNGGGFGSAAIDYQPVLAAGRADERPYRIDGECVTEPLVLHLFRGDARGPKGEPLDTLGALEERALDDCANRIAQQLNDDRQTIDGRRVTPADIAVLVSTNLQVLALRKRLRARDVPCVGSGRGSVFDGEVAREFELILYAVLNAEDERAVRGALATRLLGADLAALEAWRTDSAAFERELERFAEWRAVARTRGVLALIESVLAERAGALLGPSEGERRLTDLRHLGELLAEEEGRQQGLEGLLAWFATIRREGGDGDSVASDARQLRIESDAQRVQLTTIHASKGLEYPIVYLPLAWRTKAGLDQQAPKVLRFRDEAGRLRIDVGSADFVRNRIRHHRDDLDERLRLLYVAMTRAVHALHVYWVDRETLLPDGAVDMARAWEAPAIDVLISHAQARANLVRGEAMLPQLAERLGGVAIAASFADGCTKFVAPETVETTRAVQRPAPRVRRFEWLHSFSALVRGVAAQSGAEAGAADEASITVGDTIDNVAQREDARLSALYALRGPRFGDAVHRLFETAGTTPLWPDQRALIARQLDAQAVRAPADFDGDPLELVGRMVDRGRAADLGDGLRLVDLSAQARVAEFEFQLPLQEVSVARLRRLCAAHGHADAVPATLDAYVLNGMLTGFIDLVFAWQGRYHVLDYKTNWLGVDIAGYRGAALEAAMHEHHYPLQALLYTVALHRYLRQRVRDYAPETHLGESWYLFVRAVGLEPAAGVWRRRWPSALIVALDDAFAGITEVAA